LLSPQRASQFTQAQVEIFNRAIAIAQAGVEFAFAQGEDVGAEFETLFVDFGEAVGVALFKKGAAFAFFERLHPQGFGDVGDGFR
jgi:hypothetical protein